MSVKQNPVKKSVRKFFHRHTTRWSWLLVIMLAVIGLASNLLPVLADLTPGTVAVDDKINVSFSGLRLNRNTNTFDSLATLTNQSTVPIDIPVQLAITTISSSTVKLANATGVQSNGAPYVNVPISDGILDPGESVSNILLKFNNPQKTAFTFKHIVFGVLPKANHPPVANAGDDQSVPVGTEVTLNGINSTDEDGDPLTYRWRIVSQPAGNPSQLDNATAIAPKLLINRKGIFQIELIVNDGQVDSQAALVVINTENSRPVAEAGDGQTVLVQHTAQLDGINSKDIDGDSITYQWQLIAKPAGSQAALQNATTQTPSLTPDKPGDYTVELIVNDGMLNSDPDRVIISTENSKPVADAGPDQQVVAGTPALLDGQLSKDVDDDPLSYAWSLLNQPANSNPVLQNADQAKCTLIPDLPGDYVSQLIVNDGKVNSEPDTALVTVSVEPPVNHPPQISTSPTLTATVGKSYSYDVEASDSDNDTLTYSLSTFPTGMAINPQTGLINWTPASGQTGSQSVTVTVSDSKGGHDSQSFVITVTDTPIQNQTTVPDVTGNTRSAAQAAIQQAKLNLGNETFQHNSTIADGKVISQSPLANNEVPIGTTVNMVISLGPDNGLPPNPATVAPPVDPTVPTTVDDSTKFLYSGANPIQTLSNGQHLAEGTIEARRAGVVSGKVSDKNGQPLPGVTLTIFNHPEYGQTLSRTDGKYDLAVNGGGWLTVDFQKEGFLPVHRKVYIPWQEFAPLDEVVMLARDSVASLIDFTDPIQVHRASVMEDSDGRRQATLFFLQGTHATMNLANGSTQPLNRLTVRATEFTVGKRGRAAMPGDLPPASMYTYALSYNIDEADDATGVTLDPPAISYTENFISAPVGTVLPAGSYDRSLAAWIPERNGRVVKLLGVESGLAQLDVDGHGVAATPERLAELNIGAPERTQLAETYEVGQELWRVPISHFSSWDINLGWAPVTGSESPEGEADQDPDCNRPCTSSGSILENQNQVVGQSMPVVGAPFSVNYRSSRTGGFTDPYKFDIQLSDQPPGLPPLALEIDVTIHGRVLEARVPNPSAGHRVTMFWDGLDSYGRRLQGPHAAKICMSYIYPVVYVTVDNIDELLESFGYNGNGVSIGALRADATVPLRTCLKASDVGGGSDADVFPGFSSSDFFRIGGFNAKDSAAGLGGWTLDIHHTLAPATGMLYLGSGVTRDTAQGTRIIDTFAGGGNVAIDTGVEAPANKANIPAPQSIAFGPDGSMYVAITHQVLRITPDGIVRNFAGRRSSSGFSGDGGPADRALLSNLVRGVDVGPDGSVYFADSGNQRVRKVDPNGTITTVAGNGVNSFDGNEGPALNAGLAGLRDVAVSPDGTLYLLQNAGTNGSALRRVTPDGVIRTMTTRRACPEGPDQVLPIGRTCLHRPNAITLAPDGSIYVAEGIPGLPRVVRKIDPAGIVGLFAGNGSPADGIGDGLTAQEASLGIPWGVAVSPEGSVYIAAGGLDHQNRVRFVDDTGIIQTLAGSGDPGFSGDRGPALLADLRLANGGDVVYGPDHAVYVAEPDNNRIRRISNGLPGYTASTDIGVPSEDGTELFIFDAAGRHLRTLNTLTGTVIWSFGYDEHGRLSTVTDAYNAVTRIQRNALGVATRIDAPDGQVTQFEIDANGYLAGIVNPAAERERFGYSPLGLMTLHTTPRGNQYTYDYQPITGRLQQATNPEGGFQHFERQKLPGQAFEVTRTTAEGRSTKYRFEQFRNGRQKRATTFPDGNVVESDIQGQERVDTLFPDGTQIQERRTPDPRFGMQAPLPNVTLKQGGLTSTLTTQRTVQLVDPNDLLSLTQLTDTMTLNGRASTSVYDAATRSVTNTSSTGRRSTTVIDGFGKMLQSQVAGFLPAHLTYDARGRLQGLAQGTGADERTVAASHNPEGYLASVTDSLGQTLGYTYDAAGRVTRQILPDDREIGYGYDADDNLTSLAPPGRPDHTFHYTPVDLTSEYVPPDVGAGANRTVYQYNHDKDLTRIIRPDAKMLDFIYDAAGRPQTLTLPDASTFGYVYNALGQLNGITASDGVTLSYTYNGALLAETGWDGPVVGQVGYAYDNNFRITSLSVNGANAIDFHYDADSLLTQAGELTLNRSTENGLLTGSTLGGVTDGYDYDGFAQVATYSARFGTTELLQEEYRYDKLGRITRKMETIQGVADTYNYGYDVAGRLIEVRKNGTVQSTYGYDSNGNRLSRNIGGFPIVGTYDAQDRLLSYGGATFAYTANGELMTKTEGAQTTHYDYDALGNLKRVLLPDGTAIEYLVDGRNRRIGKKVNGTLVQGFLYDGQLNIVAELDGNNQVVTRFVPGGMIRGGVTYRILRDHLGSPRLVLNAATGEVAQRMDYDEFGRTILDTHPGFQPFGWAGGIYDHDTGLVRFGVRDYDSETGRWTAKDIIGFAGLDTNLYVYTGGDPINRIDPTGQVPAVAGAVGFALGLVFGELHELYNIYFDARAEAEMIFGENPGETPRNNIGDAYRHCLASCETADTFGDGFARFLGQLNETKGDWFQDQPEGEKLMDQFNNECGIRAASSSSTCSNACYSMAGYGQLVDAPVSQ